MGGTEVESLHSILCNGERKLENIKFFPGSNRGLTAAQICRTASAALESVFSRPLVDEPPMSGRVKASIDATP